MKIKIINNPSSGMQTVQKKLPALIGSLILDKIVDSVDKYDTSIDFDYDHAVGKNNENGYDLMVAIGGDGTVNKVASAMIRTNTNIPLLVIPAGTVNDLASYLRLPNNLEDMYNIIKNMKTRKMDVCKANDDYFINVAAAGILADVALNTPTEYKTTLGSLAYYANGLKEVPRQLFENIKFRFEYDNIAFSSDAFLFAVLNSKSAGGFSNFAPNAALDDGLFDVCIIKKMDIIDAAGVFLKVFNGDHINDSNVIYFQTNELKVSLPNEDDIVLDIDGDKGSTFPILFSIKKHALDVVVP